ncbi:hypothetical protein H8356DRAFT_1350423 [Neocallimastix lanati (nom. inval.)]|nr:hypothetical protein H8356DRAFT_1350423 [Neocallimastix sp. JGI-2020a]
MRYELLSCNLNHYIPVKISCEENLENGALYIYRPTTWIEPGSRQCTRYCLNSEPERVALVTVINILTREFLVYGFIRTEPARDSLGVRHRKSIPKKIALENLSNNMLSTKCRDVTTLIFPEIEELETKTLPSIETFSKTPSFLKHAYLTILISQYRDTVPKTNNPTKKTYSSVYLSQYKILYTDNSTIKGNISIPEMNN